MALRTATIAYSPSSLSVVPTQYYGGIWTAAPSGPTISGPGVNPTIARAVINPVAPEQIFASPPQTMTFDNIPVGTGYVFKGGQRDAAGAEVASPVYYAFDVAAETSIVMLMSGATIS